MDEVKIRIVGLIKNINLQVLQWHKSKESGVKNGCKVVSCKGSKINKGINHSITDEIYDK